MALTVLERKVSNEASAKETFDFTHYYNLEDTRRRRAATDDALNRMQLLLGTVMGGHLRLHHGIDIVVLFPA